MTPECERLALVARPIEDVVDVEALRQIRNACKDGFSHDTTEISAQAQRAWWVAQRGRVKAWLYWRSDLVIGYGLLRQTDDGRWWTSVAVLPFCAGQGYGGAITADLIRRSDGPVYATARLDNPAARRLHRAADWEETGRDERLVYFQTRYSVQAEAALANWQESGWVLT